MSDLIQNIKNKLNNAKKNTTMKKQLTRMYIAAVLFPLSLVGIVLSSMSIHRLISYEKDMAVSTNNTVRSTLYEITGQVYNVSEEIAYSDRLTEALSKEFVSEADFAENADMVDDMMDYYRKHFTSIDSVSIYMEGDYVVDTNSIVNAGDVNFSEDWYSEAVNRYSASWTTIKSEDLYGNVVYNLALIRQIPLFHKGHKAVLVIKVNDNYLRSRIEAEHYYTVLSMKDGSVPYSTNRVDCESLDLFDYPEDDAFYEYKGRLSYHNQSYIGHVSTLSMVKSDSYIRITTLSLTGNSVIWHTILVTLLLVITGMVLPAIIMRIFTEDIVHQVDSLRKEMNKASVEDYDLEYYEGCYELTEAYHDLQTLIERIKDRDARMYQNEIAEQKLVNEQQLMEFKMLASQINPHFLYNTLEMIRMKALSVGDKETATAIRLLGQSMRYVLDNTGTEVTTLAKELKHIETYLQIQKLRFGDRVNYELIVDDGIVLEEVQMLPLLLQPIVENAVLHGLEEVESGGLIKTHIYRDTEYSLCIRISDNGCGMDEETLSEMRRNLMAGHINNRYGIGLYNINQRLRISYGEDYGITIDSKSGEGTTVCARLLLYPGQDK